MAFGLAIDDGIKRLDLTVGGLDWIKEIASLALA
jgi:hypothetical protein